MITSPLQLFLSPPPQSPLHHFTSPYLLLSLLHLAPPHATPPVLLAQLSYPGRTQPFLPAPIHSPPHLEDRPHTRTFLTTIYLSLFRPLPDLRPSSASASSPPLVRTKLPRPRHLSSHYARTLRCPMPLDPKFLSQGAWRGVRREGSGTEGRREKSLSLPSSLLAIHLRPEWRKENLCCHFPGKALEMRRREGGNSGKEALERELEEGIEGRWEQKALKRRRRRKRDKEEG